MESNTREFTNKLIDMIAEGSISPSSFIRSVFAFFSEAEIKDLAISEGFIEEDEPTTCDECGEDIEEDDEQADGLNTYCADCFESISE